MNENTKKLSKKKLIEIREFIYSKQDMFSDILQRTLLSANQLKMMDIISSSNLAICNDCLELLFKNLHRTHQVLCRVRLVTRGKLWHGESVLIRAPCRSAVLAVQRDDDRRQVGLA